MTDRTLEEIRALSEDKVKELYLTRKCHKCKQSIIIGYEEFIRYSNIYYHIDCFKKEALTIKRFKKDTELINKFILETKKDKTDPQADYDLQEFELIRWLQKRYNTNIGSHFFTKLQHISEGTYKGFKSTEKVKLSDILEIWQRKYSEFEKLAIYQKTAMGKVIEGDSRVNYDLAIVLSKYQSFMKWKAREEQRKKEAEEMIKKDEKPIDYSKYKPKKEKYVEITDDDLED